jgi:hypothetical protein
LIKLGKYAEPLLPEDKLAYKKKKMYITILLDFLLGYTACIFRM